MKNYLDKETGKLESIEEIEKEFNEIIANSNEFNEYIDKFDEYLQEFYIKKKN